MLLITPEYAALREEKARATIDWLVGNFKLRPLAQPTVGRLMLGKAKAKKATKPKTSVGKSKRHAARTGSSRKAGANA